MRLAASNDDGRGNSSDDDARGNDDDANGDDASVRRPIAAVAAVAQEALAAWELEVEEAETDGPPWASVQSLRMTRRTAR
jgi:hypothetical protein